MTTRLTKLILVLALAFGGLLTVQPSADAATAVSFCFRYPSGARYANLPVKLYSAKPGYFSRSGRTNSSGCGTFTNVPPRPYGVYVKVDYWYGSDTYGYQVYYGQTRTAPAGSGSYNLGTVYLQSACTQGTQGYCYTNIASP
jgi:hypothetical protein